MCATKRLAQSTCSRNKTKRFLHEDNVDSYLGRYKVSLEPGYMSHYGTFPQEIFI